jgi:hypothetical protein
LLELSALSALTAVLRGLLRACLNGWLRFSAGSNHIKGLMCHVGLATFGAASETDGRR